MNTSMQKRRRRTTDTFFGVRLCNNAVMTRFQKFSRHFKQNFSWQSTYSGGRYYGPPTFTLRRVAGCCKNTLTRRIVLRRLGHAPILSRAETAAPKWMRWIVPFRALPLRSMRTLFLFILLTNTDRKKLGIELCILVRVCYGICS